MKTKPCLLAAGCLFTALTVLNAHAQGTLVLTPSLVDLTIAPYQDHADFTFPTPTVSLANYGGIGVTFSAPAGHAWRFEPSVAGDGLACYVCYGSSSSGAQGFIPYSFNFVPGMGGTVTTSPSDLAVWDAETSFGFDYTFHFGGTVEFTDFTVTTGHSVTLDMFQRQLSLTPFSEAYLAASVQGVPALTLVPIPEPGMAALSSLMLACAAARLNLI